VRLVARLLAFLAPLVLLLGLLGLAALRRRVVHALAFFPSKMAPTASSPEAKLVVMSNSSFESASGLLPKLAHEVPIGRALEESVYDLGLGHARELRAALEEALYEVLERLTGFLVAHAQAQELPGRTYVPWKFPTKVRTRSSQLWIWLAGRCSSHVLAESARCSGRLWMLNSSVAAPPSWHVRR
jgi:hypothetical protein